MYEDSLLDVRVAGAPVTQCISERMDTVYVYQHHFQVWRAEVLHELVQHTSISSVSLKHSSSSPTRFSLPGLLIVLIPGTSTEGCVLLSQAFYMCYPI